MSDAIRRAIRTFVQSAIGVIVLQAAALMADANDGSIDANLWRRIGVTAIVAGLIALVSYIQNALEDNTRLPSVLKANASEGQNPVTQDPIK